MTVLAESKMAMVVPSFLDSASHFRGVNRSSQREICFVASLFRKSSVGIKTVFLLSFIVLRTCLFTYPFFRASQYLHAQTYVFSRRRRLSKCRYNHEASELCTLIYNIYRSPSFSLIKYSSPINVLLGLSRNGHMWPKCRGGAPFAFFLGKCLSFTSHLTCAPCISLHILFPRAVKGALLRIFIYNACHCFVYDNMQHFALRRK